MEKIAQHCQQQRELLVFGMLYLFTYCFLLRLPSEALPVRLGADGVEEDTIVLVLTRR